MRGEYGTASLDVPVRRLRNLPGKLLFWGFLIDELTVLAVNEGDLLFVNTDLVPAFGMGELSC
jgi:hypothetical protein